MVAKYLLVWFLLAIVAITNGIIRQSTYGKSVSELAAHQISTVTAIVAFGVVVWSVHRRWPIETPRQAWTIGLLWLLMTVAFELGFGHFVGGHSWPRLLADFNLLNGRVWAVFLVWVAVLPFAVFKVSTRAAQ